LQKWERDHTFTKAPKIDQNPIAFLSITQHQVFMRTTKLLFLIAFSFITCSENDSPKVVIDRIEFNDNEVGVFYYNSNKLLSKYELFSNNELYSYKEFIYSNNQLVKRNNFLKGKNGFISTSDTYIYENDKIVEIVDDTFSFKHFATWDGDRIVKMSYCYENGDCFSYDKLEYDGVGNIVKVYRYAITEDRENVEKVSEYFYDNKVNPLHQFTSPAKLFFGDFNFYESSINNITKYDEKNTVNSLPYRTTSYTLTYNENGLPNEVSISLVSGISVINSKRKFYYKTI